MINNDEQMNETDISLDEMMLLKSGDGSDTDRLILGDGENCIFSSDSQKIYTNGQKNFPNRHCNLRLDIL